MKDEWHITVVGDQHEWRGWCTNMGIKPLRIELSTFEVQLMCAIPGTWVTDEYGPCVSPDAAIASLIKEMQTFDKFHVVRVKHEVQCHAIIPRVLYYECHVKLDGPFAPAQRMASRDLFRDQRWYLTRRRLEPFDALYFVECVRHQLLHDNNRSVISGWEYEAAIIDTYPELDSRWVREH